MRQPPRTYTSLRDSTEFLPACSRLAIILTCTLTVLRSIFSVENGNPSKTYCAVKLFRIPLGHQRVIIFVGIMNRSYGRCISISTLIIQAMLTNSEETNHFRLSGCVVNEQQIGLAGERWQITHVSRRK